MLNKCLLLLDIITINFGHLPSQGLGQMLQSGKRALAFESDPLLELVQPLKFGCVTLDELFKLPSPKMSSIHAVYQALCCSLGLQFLYL